MAWRIMPNAALPDAHGEAAALLSETNGEAATFTVRLVLPELLQGKAHTFVTPMLLVLKVNSSIVIF